MRLYAGFADCPYGAYLDFEVTLSDPCAEATISFDNQQTVMDNIETRVGANDPPATINTDAVIVTPSISICQTLEYSVEN